MIRQSAALPSAAGACDDDGMTIASFAPSSGQIIDITLPIAPSLPVWPGDPPIDVRPLERIAHGASANTTQLLLPTHCGTHVDPPFHVLAEGARVDQLVLETLIGPVWIAQLPADIMAIDRATLDAATVPPATQRLLLRTANSTRNLASASGFQEDFAALTPDGAAWCIDRGIRLIGIDGPGIERFDAHDLAVHHVLLAQGVVIIEGLDLRQAPVGSATLICLPLRLANGDGAPARAVLVTP